jgi:hypothetical protein
MADDLIEERIKRKARPAPERVRSRQRSLEREQPEMDDTKAAAERLLSDSESRTETDPAPRDLREDRVERRTSEDATPPAEEP